MKKKEKFPTKEEISKADKEFSKKLSEADKKWKEIIKK